MYIYFFLIPLKNYKNILSLLFNIINHVHYAYMHLLLLFILLLIITNILYSIIQND